MWWPDASWLMFGLCAVFLAIVFNGLRSLSGGSSLPERSRACGASEEEWLMGKSQKYRVQTMSDVGQIEEYAIRSAQCSSAVDEWDARAPPPLRTDGTLNSRISMHDPASELRLFTARSSLAARCSQAHRISMAA